MTKWTTDPSGLSHYRDGDWWAEVSAHRVRVGAVAASEVMRRQAERRMDRR